MPSPPRYLHEALSVRDATMNRESNGFTLIELLIVIVIVGLLAAIAIPKFANTKDRALLASMKTDLRNLVNAQESYQADYQTYTSDLGTRYQESPGVTVALQGVTASGWAATAVHQASMKSCAIYYGSGATPVPPATQEGVPACQ